MRVDQANRAAPCARASSSIRAQIRHRPSPHQGWPVGFSTPSEALGRLAAKRLARTQSPARVLLAIRKAVSEGSAPQGPTGPARAASCVQKRRVMTACKPRLKGKVRTHAQGTAQGLNSLEHQTPPCRAAISRGPYRAARPYPAHRPARGPASGASSPAAMCKRVDFFRCRFRRSAPRPRRQPRQAIRPAKPAPALRRWQKLLRISS